jgi:hypothetical protein
VHSLLQFANLWDNPVFHRFRRSQLRLKASSFWLLAALIITTFVVSLTYIVQTNIGYSAEAAARNQWMPLLVIQGLILLIKGTGRTSAGLIQDKIDQTLDYQRLTPVPPMRNVIGYLFGLPLLEYVMFALTLPHLAFIVIKGNIPLTTVFSVYLAFFVCTIFYHTTAIAVGMVMKRWIFGYLLSIFSVAFLNLILAPLGSQLGLKFMQYLSVFPVIGQKVTPLVSAPPGVATALNNAQQFSSNQNDGLTFSFADPVPFFDWTLSPFLFTLLLQAGLIVTFATMAVRRWKKANKHSLSKLYALGVLSGFVVLVTGNLWPVITRQYMPFSVFGMRSFDQLSEAIAVSLPLVYSMAAWFLCIFLFFITVPTHHSYVRGVRRAKKLNRKAALPWDDDSANIPFMSLFVLVALIGFWVLHHEMRMSGFMDFLDGTDYSAWRLPLLFGLVLFYSLLLIQALEHRGTVLTILLLWFVPILVAIVSAAAMEDMTRFQTVVASLSPLATTLMAGLLPLESVVPLDPGENFEVVHTGFQTGLAFLVLQIVLLAWRWRHLSKTLR